LKRFLFLALSLRDEKHWKLYLSREIVTDKKSHFVHPKQQTGLKLDD